MKPFWLRPKWIAGHAFALVAVVLFTSLGLWQLDRLEQRRAHNDLVAGRVAAEPLSLAEVLALPEQEAAHRLVRLSGVYEPAGEVLLSLRTLDGRAGHHVLTPLRTPRGTVVVDRGWVPYEWDDVPLADALPPAGVIEVEGFAQPGETARRSGRFDGAQGPLEFVSHVDLDVIGRSLGEPVAPVYVQARSQQPPGGSYPVPAARPAPLGEGNHLSYAVQWFLFASVVALGYPLLLRRTAREQHAGGQPHARPPATVAR